MKSIKFFIDFSYCLLQIYIKSILSIHGNYGLLLVNKGIIHEKIAYILGSTTCIFVLYLATLFLMQDKLLFKPDNNYISPQKANLTNVSENMLTMSDGTKVMTWIKDGDKNLPAILA